MAVKFFSKQLPETKTPQFYKSVSWIGLTIMIVINIMIGGFSGEDLKWLADVRATVQLQVSGYSQLSDYTVRLQLCRLIRAK